MRFLVLALLIICLIACKTGDNNIDNNLTGQEVVSTLYQGSDYNISGTVTFKETKTDGTLIVIDLSGTKSGLLHSAHLHYMVLPEMET